MTSLTRAIARLLLLPTLMVAIILARATRSDERRTTSDERRAVAGRAGGGLGRLLAALLRRGRVRR